MEIAMIGLGKMGANMAKRLLEGGHRVVGYDPLEEAVKNHEEAGGAGARSLEEALQALQSPRSVWVIGKTDI
jgi:6-phosphogluconate dehydrogenase